jgi:hypothetical protein
MRVYTGMIHGFWPLLMLLFNRHFFDPLSSEEVLVERELREPRMKGI